MFSRISHMNIFSLQLLRGLLVSLNSKPLDFQLTDISCLRFRQLASPSSYRGLWKIPRNPNQSLRMLSHFLYRNTNLVSQSSSRVLSILLNLCR